MTTRATMTPSMSGAAAGRTRRIAVAIMSFDRPRYLERILQSVRAQHPLEGAAPEIFLFQDGHVSPHSGDRFGDPDKMAASVDLFRRYLPHGHVWQAEVNYGVAMNFDRAERAVFEQGGFDAAIFLEDDMILQPDYFRILEAMLDLAEDRDDIGMVSARGYRDDTPLAVQRAHEGQVRLMDEHNWAFALRRHAWEARDAVLRPYLSVLGGIDYRQRDKDRNKAIIKALQESFGRHGRGYLSSQDSTKNMAMELLGLHRITTYTNHARYIGREGEHSTAEKFEKRGYHRTILFDRMPRDLILPSADELRLARLGLRYR